MEGAKHINWKDLLAKPEYRGGIMWTRDADTHEDAKVPQKEDPIKNDQLEMTLKRLIDQEVKRLGK